MKRLWATFVLLALFALPGIGQKIETEVNDSNQIIHLKTALNHLTVIELREPVAQVATGSQSFKVEWRENKVFVQPTEANASTNLFIWTGSRRLNYELEPAGDVARMDFAVDQPPIQGGQAKLTDATPSRPSPMEMLLAGKPIRLESAKPTKKPVEVVMRDLYERNGRVLIRYAVRNRSRHDYDVNAPQVFELTGVRYPQSLYGLGNSQLGDREAERLWAAQQTPVTVLEGRVQSSHLAPGEETIGVVALRLRSSAEPTVLRFQFGNDDKEQITAVLVR
jgi:hypothetical protein